MKYDDAAWHYEGDFPSDLPNEAAATHAGMFFAWALLSGLGSDLFLEDCPDSISSLLARVVTPGIHFLKSCDGKLSDQDLNEEGNAFAQVYFDVEKSEYLSDYEATLGSGVSNLYYVKDNWDNFDLLTPVLDSRYKAWRSR